MFSSSISKSHQKYYNRKLNSTHAKVLKIKYPIRACNSRVVWRSKNSKQQINRFKTVEYTNRKYYCVKITEIICKRPVTLISHQINGTQCIYHFSSEKCKFGFDLYVFYCRCIFQLSAFITIASSNFLQKVKN